MHCEGGPHPRFENEASIWSVVTIDSDAQTFTVGETLEHTGEAYSINHYAATDEVFLFVGNDTHWIVLSVDPSTGKTIKELTSWA